MWLSEFLYASIEVLWSRLRVGGFIVFQSVRYDYIGEYMMKEHVENKQDAEFIGILSRVTSSGRYKPNWVWQKVNRSTSTSEPRKVEEIEEQQEEVQGKQEEGEGKPQKKKVIYVKRKTLKKSPSPPSPS